MKSVASICISEADVLYDMEMDLHLYGFETMQQEDIYACSGDLSFNSSRHTHLRQWRETD